MRFGQWLLNEKNTKLYGLAAFGLPFWGIMVWFLWDYSHSAARILFLGAMSLLGGYCWGWGMWHLVGRSRQAQRDIKRSDDV